MRDDITTLKSGNIVLAGLKTFSSTPRITANVLTSNDTNVTNVKCVKTMIDDRSGFMTEGQYVNKDPENGGRTGTAYDGDAVDPQQMYWHIDHNQFDSSEWLDEYGAKAGAAICKYTGNLVCYGWLADNGNVRPEQAWVGIYGHVKCGSDSQLKWVALQI